MSHAMIRATMIPVIVQLIAEKYHLSELIALDKFYTSATGASYADDETGLYGQSEWLIFGLFCDEKNASERGNNETISERFA